MNRNLKKAVIETNPSEAVFVTALFSWRHCFRGGIVFVAALFSWQHCFRGSMMGGRVCF